MTQTLLLLVTVLRALVEVAGLKPAGPASRAVRVLLPAAISDRHIPFVSLFVLLWL